nr:MAG TPA: hypothetical protein [Caudoviricetes sp.]
MCHLFHSENNSPFYYFFHIVVTSFQSYNSF